MSSAHSATVSVVVGSQSSPKLVAVELAFKAWAPRQHFQISGARIESLVSDQPMCDEEAKRGARNRAFGALEESDTLFGVGLEAGLQAAGNLWFNCGWVVVARRDGKIGLASTVRAVVPEQVMLHVRAGMELGAACDQVFGVVGSKHAGGHFGLMTNGLVRRQDAFRDAVLLALGHLEFSPEPLTALR